MSFFFSRTSATLIPRESASLSISISFQAIIKPTPPRIPQTAQYSHPHLRLPVPTYTHHASPPESPSMDNHLRRASRSLRNVPCDHFHRDRGGCRQIQNAPARLEPKVLFPVSR